MIEKQHTKRPQNSTIAGSTTLTGALMLIFGETNITDTFDLILDLNWSQLMPIILILGGSLRSILMKEKTKDSILTELKEKKANKKVETHENTTPRNITG